MELINMKQSNKSETGIAPAESEAPRYPYGLELRLDKESLDKLGVKTLPSVPLLPIGNWLRSARFMRLFLSRPPARR